MSHGTATYMHDMNSHPLPLLSNPPSTFSTSHTENPDLQIQSNNPIPPNPIPIPIHCLPHRGGWRPLHGPDMDMIGGGGRC
ncbi:hypothetical protein BU24DRAFT_421687 [Aaosphaeria arxii CBS 175.79]|uniref:Uncharacterized protein n=1 Tax=Aaosphaeria arxii CBS 175.79 TaxID=1450172 RepID=A0A6A5XQ60_9PLEO|nr:uncharacterized protein BU24DRAFT_421687 [Aaosphaeria arxii CBS 175.79]KAF2015398.1 hypothetical protein BU24DRAFT_421687 [Aaosphaeria arxii CBS 175.79]